jgi:hypothetical protein
LPGARLWVLLGAAALDRAALTPQRPDPADRPGLTLRRSSPRGTVFCTIEGLDLVSTPAQRGWLNGHRGVWLEHGSDNMMKG